MRPNTPYWQKLQDPRWQKKRLEIFERDNFACRSCGANNKSLNVHHLYYVSGRNPWEYPDGSLKTLCSECHDEHKESEKKSDWEIFVEIENDFNGATGGETTNFIMSLILCCHRTGESTCEMLALLAMAMEEGLIDRNQIKTWRLQLKNIQKKRNEHKSN